MSQPLSEDDCRVLLHSLLGAELAASRGAAIPAWQDSLEIDSLERLRLAACVNEFFCLHETGLEDRLLMADHIDDWTRLVAQSVGETSGLTFRTSGSTGVPAAHLHRGEHIWEEAESLSRCLAVDGLPTRVVSWLPLHHLYGFMWGVALPRLSGVPRYDVSGTVPPRVSAGDLLVTVPPRWDYLARARTSWPDNVRGVSSTAPLSRATSDALMGQGLAGMVEVYGSTETGGVATRWERDVRYELLPHWQRADAQHIRRGDDGEAIALLDDIEWHDAQSFALKGRHDGVVVIGGVNVSLTFVALRLQSLSSVADCAVRTAGPEPQQRLKAFIVPAASEDEAAREIASTIARWPAAERPVGITFGSALPTNAMGKRADW